MDVDEAQEGGYEEEDEDDDGFDAQFAHSSRIANQHYGLYDAELRQLRTHKLERFRQVSQVWHQFLGLVGVENIFVRATSQRRVQAAVVDANTPTRAVDVPRDGAEMVEGQRPVPTTLPGIKRTRKALISGDRRLITRAEAKKTRDHLISLLGDSSAVFKSIEQQSAADVLLHTEDDLIAVLPTGSGKSLLFFLLAMTIPSKTIVIVMPTISLKNDLLARARRHGISCNLDFREFKGEQLVLVTPEAATVKEFRTFFMSLYSQRQLGRLFIDEAHLYSTASYRPSFRMLPFLRCVPVPLCLMTATAPPWIVEDWVLS